MKIEKNIPLPQKSKAGRPRKYPFADMDVGDSIFFPMCPDGSQGRTAWAARSYARRVGKEFMTSSQPGHDGITGVRIWRIA